ncbi:MAG: right-handed parallel beta-helix repeat-containing protein, partial [Pseudomonadota bacterium]
SRHSGTIFAENNYWGTTDPEAIGLSISDRSDNSEAPAVDFIPFLDAQGKPVADSHLLAGDITADKSLSLGDYILVGEIRINTGATLTIPAGTTIRATKQSRITVFGTLMAVGSTGTGPVTFSGAGIVPEESSWEGIIVQKDGTATLTNCVVEWARYGLVSYGSISIKRCVFESNVIGVLLRAESQSSLEQSTLVNNSEYGVCLEGDSAADHNPKTGILKNNNFIANYYHIHGRNFGNSSQTVIDAQYNYWGQGSHIPSGWGMPQIDKSHALAAPAPYPSAHSIEIPKYYIAPAAGRELEVCVGFTPDIDSCDITILNSSGLAVRSDSYDPDAVSGSFTVEGYDAGSLPAFTGYPCYSWDGKNDSGVSVPDGEYTICIDAGTTTPSVSAALTREQRVIIDSAAPNATLDFSSCGEGNTVFGAISFKISGGDKNVYKAELKYAGYPLTDPKWNSVPSLENIVLADLVQGNPLPFNTSSLPNGDYVIRLTVTDLAGNVTTKDRQIKIDNIALYVPDQSHHGQVSPAFISPARGEQAGISYTTDRTCRVTVDFYKDTAELIDNGVVWGAVRIPGARAVSSIVREDRAAGKYTETWNGRTAGGECLEPGVYRYVITVEADGRKTVWDSDYADGSMTVDGKVSALCDYAGLEIKGRTEDTFNPYKGEYLRLKYKLSLSAWVFMGFPDLNPFLCGEPRRGADALPGAPEILVEHEDCWDGRYGAKNKKRLVTEKIGEGKFQAIGLGCGLLPRNCIVVQNDNLHVHTITTEPYLMLPLYSQVSAVKFTLDTAADVTVDIYDPNGDYYGSALYDTATGEPVQMENVYLASGTHQFEWRGEDNAGRIKGVKWDGQKGLEGDYRVEIRAYDPAYKTEVVKNASICVY